MSVHGNRAWCFTLNNPTDEEKLLLPTSPESLPLWPRCTALVYQLEEGENGTPHIQGYARFDRQRTLATVKTILARAHWEPAKGSIQANLDYCGKQLGRLSEPVIIGFGGLRPGASGPSKPHLKRAQFVDLIASSPDVSIPELLDQGALEVLATQPNLLGTLRGFLFQDLRRDGVIVDLYYGLTGTGKSRLAFDEYPGAFRKTSGSWWDSYAGELSVVLDDFDDAFMPIGDLLRTLDRYPLRMPVKGGFIQLIANHFIITSNHLPSEWYPNAPPCRLAAVHRRFRNVVEFKDGYITTHLASNYFNVGATSLTPGLTTPLPWTVTDRPVTPTQPYMSPELTDSQLFATMD
ncbi:replication-associated protein [Pacific flying fox faeces associated circular DNA virus-13]|nr:replication-associated protein [Pacific flying fox faeces associated circular DNA virus-13]